MIEAMKHIPMLRLHTLSGQRPERGIHWHIMQFCQFNAFIIKADIIAQCDCLFGRQIFDYFTQTLNIINLDIKTTTNLSCQDPQPTKPASNVRY